MIERMQKITLLVSAKEQEDFIEALKETGAVHVKHLQPPAAHEITFIEDKISKLDAMLTVLGPFAPEKGEEPYEPPCSEQEIIEIANEILDAHKEKEDCFIRINDLEKQSRWFDVWGGFDPVMMSELERKSIKIKLYKLNKDQFKETKEKKDIYVVKKDKDYIYVAAISVNEENDLPFEEIIPPKISQERIKELIKNLRHKVKGLENKIREEAVIIGFFKKCKKRFEKEKEFFSVFFGMKEEGRFALFQGFCPEKRIKKVIKMAEKNGIGYFIEDIKDPEDVPVLITNPRWIRIINPVFQFMNTLPGYDEFDISAPFLIFFSIFFAMLIGDAGYGFLFLFLTIFAQRKFKNIPKEPIFLLYVLSSFTILWGAVTGTWFGAEQIARLPFFHSLVVEKISSFGDANQNFLIFLCFIIGAVQLTIAHLFRAVRIINSSKVLAELGWIMILWGMFFAAGKFVIGRVFPSYGVWLFSIGIGLVLFFSKPEKGILKGVLSTLAELPLSIISSFSDIVSYLRLFAVGYASVIVAESFNEMALAGGINSVMGGFIAAIILFLGHTLNIVLGCMAVVVHGVRLNMLEFSGHLGMQWSGKKYEPFKEEVEEGVGTKKMSGA
ncbi:MAG: hypothetical protein KAI70_05090 [Candidatus Omnitrophica bacterium]|nr:hypothetical protein [Candidatus Omnitrophota bacterium]